MCKILPNFYTYLGKSLPNLGKEQVNIYPHCVQVNIYTIFMCMGKHLHNIYVYG